MSLAYTFSVSDHGHPCRHQTLAHYHQSDSHLDILLFASASSTSQYWHPSLPAQLNPGLASISTSANSSHQATELDINSCASHLPFDISSCTEVWSQTQSRISLWLLAYLGAPTSISFPGDVIQNCFILYINTCLLHSLQDLLRHQHLFSSFTPGLTSTFNTLTSNRLLASAHDISSQHKHPTQSATMAPNTCGNAKNQSDRKPRAEDGRLLKAVIKQNEKLHSSIISGYHGMTPTLTNAIRSGPSVPSTRRIVRRRRKIMRCW